MLHLLHLPVFRCNSWKAHPRRLLHLLHLLHHRTQEEAVITNPNATRLSDRIVMHPAN
ncbi:hypothetical protein OKW45_005685 [Paraburkholderia sp. WSM4175]